MKNEMNEADQLPSALRDKSVQVLSALNADLLYKFVGSHPPLLSEISKQAAKAHVSCGRQFIQEKWTLTRLSTNLSSLAITSEVGFATSEEKYGVCVSRFGSSNRDFAVIAEKNFSSEKNR